jgi:hypothetical protein
MDFVFSAHGIPYSNRPKNSDLHKTSIPKPSFKEKLLGSTQETHPREKEDLLEKKLVCIEFEDGNYNIPFFPRIILIIYYVSLYVLVCDLLSLCVFYSGLENFGLRRVF